MAEGMEEGALSSPVLSVISRLPEGLPFEEGSDPSMFSELSAASVISVSDAYAAVSDCSVTGV